MGSPAQELRADQSLKYLWIAYHVPATIGTGDTAMNIAGKNLAVMEVIFYWGKGQ